MKDTLSTLSTMYEDFEIETLHIFEVRETEEPDDREIIGDLGAEFMSKEEELDFWLDNLYNEGRDYSARTPKDEDGYGTGACL